MTLPLRARLGTLVDLGMIVIDDDKSLTKGLIEPRAHLGHDGLDLRGVETGGQGLDSLDVGEGFSPAVGGLRRRSETEQWSGLISNDLNPSTLVRSPIPGSQDLEDSDSNLEQALV